MTLMLNLGMDPAPGQKVDMDRDNESVIKLCSNDSAKQKTQHNVITARNPAIHS